MRVTKAPPKIGDLRSWIAQSKADYHFLVKDIVLGILALALGYAGWYVNHIHRPAS